MSTVTLIRRFTFAAGHRVMGHEGKCRSMHGHNYEMRVSIEASVLDQLGRVIDFSEVKRIVGGWLDENWDHAMIYYAADDEVRRALMQCPGKAFELRLNPTAENMALVMLELILPSILPQHLRARAVHIRETENCFVEVTADA